jgi:hypothetical protein
MSRINKTLCKVSKEGIKGDFVQLIEIVKKPKFICEKCARVSKRKKYLCHPIRITKISK